MSAKSDYDEMMDALREAWEAWQPWMREAKTDVKHVLGDQWKDSDKAYLDAQGRPHLVINNLRRFHNLLVGYQRQNRLGISYKPFEGSDAVTAEQLSDLARLAMENDGGYHQMSRAFASTIKAGLDWVNIFVDFNEDWESGDVGFKRTAWTKLFPDPLLQEMDLSDCNYLLRREPLTDTQAKMIIPGYKLDEGKGQAGPYEYKIILDPGELIRLREQRHVLTEFWKREWKPKTWLYDITTGEKRLFDISKSANNLESRLRFIMQQFPQLWIVRKKAKVVTLELYIGDDQVWKGEDPNGCGDFPYVPLFCYWDPEYDQMKWKLQGIIRPLRDPQDEQNKRRSQILHIINTIATSGWMWEEGALEDESQMANASGAGVQIRTKQGQLESVKQVQPPRVPLEILKLEEFLANDAQNISGINAELLAQMEKDTPGISIQLRQRQGLIIIQEIFDNLRFAKKMLGKRYAKTVQSNYSPQKVARILNQQPAPAFYTKDFQKYDCVIDDAINSPTQREYNFHKLMWFHQNVSPVHPLILLELADIPERYRQPQAQYMLAQIQNMGGLMPGAGGGKGPIPKIPGAEGPARVTLGQG